MRVDTRIDRRSTPHPAPLGKTKHARRRFTVLSAAAGSAMTCPMIEGDWTIIAVDFGGEALPGRSGRLEIVGERFALQLGGSPREVGRVDYRPAPADQPGPDALDLVWRAAGEHEIRRLRAIVRVRGDLMQICYQPDEAADRPPAFRSDGPTPAILVRCKRRPAA